mgnify:CR=1 FL=1
MEPIIKVDNVSMCFNLSTEKHESLKEYLLAMVQGRLQYDEFYALKDVSLDIMPGDFYGLVGLNGSGKSTLLKTIAGVYKPTKGKVTVNGTIAPLIELGAGFDMDLTARENIYLNGTVLGFSPKYLDEKFDEIVEFSELQNFLDVPLKNYSSGMVARIGFAIATITKPDILIAGHDVEAHVPEGVELVVLQASLHHGKEVFLQALVLFGGEVEAHGHIVHFDDRFHRSLLLIYAARSGPVSCGTSGRPPASRRRRTGRRRGTY